MATLKLFYFDGRGLGEKIRLVLTAAGKEFEDVRFQHEEWPMYNPEAPFGQAPYIVLDGKTYGQSAAIATFLARENNLYGETNLDGLRIGEVLGLEYDAIQSVFKVYKEQDPGKKEELKKTLTTETLPRVFGFLQKLLQENGTGYFVGDKLSLADLVVQDLAYTVKKNFDYDAGASFPEVQTVISNVESNENIKNYLANRKETPF